MSSVIRVALVDDQQLVRAGFAMVLESQDDITVAWQAGNGNEAIELAQQQPVDVILMDVQMPDCDGITATGQLTADTARYPDGKTPRVIILTTFDSENYVLGALQAGASGFLLKDTQPEDLLTAVRTVSDSSAIISPQATATLITALRENPQQPHSSAGQLTPLPGLVELAATLTQRETEILILIAKGYTNNEIAAELFISLPTVKTHIGNILHKTCSRDRVHAVLFALGAGIVSPQELLTGK